MDQLSIIGALGALVVCLAIGSLGTMTASWYGDEKMGFTSPSREEAQDVERNKETKNLRAILNGDPMDVNSASASELELLPGIGPKLARRIIDDRTKNGPFTVLDDLLRVRGIGPQKLHRILPILMVHKSNTP